MEGRQNMKRDVIAKQELGQRFIFDDYLLNSRVVIWGASEIGKSLYRQLLEIVNIDVVAVIDKNAAEINNIFLCPFAQPEYLCQITFDYIIVACISEVPKREIKKFLMENGIDDKKVILVENLEEGLFYDGVNQYEIEDNADKALHQLIQADRNIKGDLWLTEKFQLWMKRYYNKLTDKADFRRKVEKAFYNSDNPCDTRIMLGCYLFELDVLDDSCYRQFMQYLSELSNKNFDWLYFLIKKTEYMEFVRHELTYEGLREQRMELWEKLGKYFCKDIKDDTISSSRTKGKLAILISDFLGENHAPAMIFRMIANLLINQGNQVKIFVISDYPEGRRSFGFCSIQYGSSEKELRMWDSYNRSCLNEEVEIEYIIENEISEILNTAVSKVINFNPECIIDMTAESPLSWKFYKHFPILHISTNSNTPGRFFTKMGVPPSRYNKEICPYQVELPLFSIIKNAKRKYKKSKRLGIPEESFVIITVGNRLSREINQELVDYVSDMLKRNKNMYWLLVGDTNVTKYFKNISRDKRFVIIPYEEDLPALYKICDVYLNPDRIGGGFSMMFAMQQNVVVAALKKNHADGAGWINENELIDGHYTELCDYIEKLYKSPKLLAEKKEKMKKDIFKKCSTEKYGEALREAIKQTEQAFEKEGFNDDM